MTFALPHTFGTGNLIHALAFEDLSPERAKQANACMACEDQGDFCSSAFAGDLEAIPEPFDKWRVIDKEFRELPVHVSLASVATAFNRAGVTKTVLKVNGSLAVRGVFHAQCIAHFAQPIAGDAGHLHASKVFNERPINIAPQVEDHGPRQSDFHARITLGIGFDRKVELVQVEGEGDFTLIAGPGDNGLGFDTTGYFEHDSSISFNAEADERFSSVLQRIRACFPFARHGLVCLSRVKRENSLHLPRPGSRWSPLAARYAFPRARSAGSASSPSARPDARGAGSAFSSLRLSRPSSLRRPVPKPSALHTRRGTLPHSCLKVVQKVRFWSVTPITDSFRLQNKSALSFGLARHRSLKHLCARLKEVGCGVQRFASSSVDNPASSEFAKVFRVASVSINQLLPASCAHRLNHRPSALCIYARREHRSGQGRPSIKQFGD